MLDQSPENKGLQKEHSEVSNSQLYDAISRNPWDDEVFNILKKRGQEEEKIITEKAKRFRNPQKAEQELLPRGFLNMIHLNDYIQMVDRMKSASTLEAKYRLLAEKAPVDPRYANWYREYKNLVWYDFVQGYTYDIKPPMINPDPFGTYPDSVYQGLEKVLKKKREEGLNVSVDLGSGTGEVSRIMASNFSSVIAIDRFQFLHDIAIDREREKGVKGVQHVVGDLTDGIPLADHSADIIVSNGLTAFIPTEKLSSFTQELARVLKKDGYYLEPEIESGGMNAREIAKEYSSNAKSLLAYMIGELVTSPGVGKSGEYPHSEKELNQAFNKAGFGSVTWSSVSDEYVTGVNVIDYKVLS